MGLTQLVPLQKHLSEFIWAIPDYILQITLTLFVTVNNQTLK